MKSKKVTLRLKRHRSIRMHLSGSLVRPRLVVRRSLNHIHAQIIDDTDNKVLLSVSTQDKEIKSKFPSAGNIKAATFFGEIFAVRAKQKGITAIVFDRAGYLYHGRVKAFADALRKGGLIF